MGGQPLEAPRASVVPSANPAKVDGDGAPEATAPPVSPLGNFPANDTYPKVPDPSIPNRMVSTKQANRPFLAYVSQLFYLTYGTGTKASIEVIRHIVNDRRRYTMPG